MINVNLLFKEQQQAHIHAARGLGGARGWAARGAGRREGWAARGVKRHAMLGEGRRDAEWAAGAMPGAGQHATRGEPRTVGSDREDDLAEEVAVDHRADSLRGQGQRQGPVDQRPDSGLLAEPGQPG
jgi:hypothetical protein